MMKKQLSLIIFLSLAWINLNSMQKNLPDQLNNLVSVLKTLQQALPPAPTSTEPFWDPTLEDVTLSIEDFELLKRFSNTIENMAIMPEEEIEGGGKVPVRLPHSTKEQIKTIIDYLTLSKEGKLNALQQMINIQSMQDNIKLMQSFHYLALKESPTYLYIAIPDQLFSLLISAPDMIENFESAIESIPDPLKQQLARMLIEKEDSFIISTLIERHKKDLPIMTKSFTWSFDDTLLAALDTTDQLNIINYQDEWKIKEIDLPTWKIGEIELLNAVSEFTWNSNNILAIASHGDAFLSDATGAVKKIFQGYFNAIQWNATNEYLATARSAQQGLKPTLLILYKKNDGWSPKRQLFFDKYINFKWSPSGRYLAYIAEKNKLFIVDTKKDQVTELGTVQSDDISWSWRDNYLIAGKQLWHLTKNETWINISINKVKHFAWNPKKDVIALFNEDRSFNIARISDQTVISNKLLVNKNIYSLAWNASGNLLAAGSDSGIIYLCYESNGGWAFQQVDTIGADPNIELTWSASNMLVARSAIHLFLFRYEQEMLKQIFTYNYAASFDKVDTLHWSPQGTYLAMIRPYSKEDASNFSIYQLSWLNDFKNLSLNQAFVYILKKRQSPIPKSLQNITLPPFLEKAL